MPMYTATIIRRVVYQRHNERVELRAADDAEANRKIRDMDRPQASSPSPLSRIVTSPPPSIA